MSAWAAGAMRRLNDVRGRLVVRVTTLMRCDLAGPGAGEGRHRTGNDALARGSEGDRVFFIL